MERVDPVTSAAEFESAQASRFSSWKFWLLAVVLHLLFFVILAHLYVRVFMPEISLQGHNFGGDSVDAAAPTAVQAPIEPQVPHEIQAPLAPVEAGRFQPVLDGLQKTLPSPVLQRLPGAMVARDGLPGTGISVPGQFGKRGANKFLLVPEKAVEDAVLKALKWLRANQNQDGSWGNAYPIAMTGLALLAFLAHGETPASREFGVTVRAALDYLVPYAAQGRMGAGPADKIEYWPYQHGIATYALAEMYALTQDPALKEWLKGPLERCVQTIINGQTQVGGWVYGYRSAHVYGSRLLPMRTMGDMSITSWQVQALKAAHLGDILPDRVANALERAVAYVKADFNSATAGFGYWGPDRALHNLPSLGLPVWSLTGAGVLCLQFWNNANSPEAMQAVRHMQNNLAFQKAQPDNDGVVRYPMQNLYGYYYATQALFLADGPNGKGWQTWDGRFRKPLISSQNGDGSFPSAKIGGEKDGAVFSTAICALMLEVWYRNDPASLKTLKTARQ